MTNLNANQQHVLGHPETFLFQWFQVSTSELMSSHQEKFFSEIHLIRHRNGPNWSTKKKISRLWKWFSVMFKILTLFCFPVHHSCTQVNLIDPFRDEEYLVGGIVRWSSRDLHRRKCSDTSRAFSVYEQTCLCSRCLTRQRPVKVIIILNPKIQRLWSVPMSWQLIPRWSILHNIWEASPRLCQEFDDEETAGRIAAKFAILG